MACGRRRSGGSFWARFRPEVMLRPMAPRRFGRRRDPLDDFHAAPQDSMHELLLDHLGGVPELEIRRLFGGAGLYSDGTMFGILYDGRVYLKTDEATRADYAARGSSAFVPRSGRTLTSYYEVPAELLDDAAALLVWARRAVAVAQARSARAPVRKRGKAARAAKKKKARATPIPERKRAARAR